MFILIVSRDDGTFLELDTMLADILVWALHNPAPSNLMVISKIISHETELLRLLCDLESKGYSIFIAHAEEATPPMLPPGSLEWHLDELLAGRKPISRANYSRHKINMIQNDISRWSHGRLVIFCSYVIVVYLILSIYILFVKPCR